MQYQMQKFLEKTTTIRTAYTQGHTFQKTKSEIIVFLLI